jgi:4-hydroxybenzoate polyprenyltransferase
MILFAALAMAHLSWWGVLFLILPAALLARQIFRLDISDPALCLKLFKSNREVGLAIAAAILIGRL